MKITAKTVKNEVTTVELSNDALVDTLRMELAKEKNVPDDNIKIIYSGKILENGKSLVEYGIVGDSNVVIMIRSPPKKQEVIPPPVELQPAEPPVNLQPVEQHISISTSTFQNSAPGVQEQIQRFRQTIEQNPEQFLQFLLSDPSINAMYQSNPQGFATMISDPTFVQNIVITGQQLFNGESDDLFEEGIDDNEENTSIVESLGLTDEDKTNIDELMNMGFSRVDVLQYYLASDKNKEIAANLLFSSRFE